MSDIMTTCRETIRFASQNCEEIGLGMHPLSLDDLAELVHEARRLIAAVNAYREYLARGMQQSEPK